MKGCQFSGLNDKELKIVQNLFIGGRWIYGFDIWFVGFNTELDLAMGLMPFFFNEIVLLYSGSSDVSKYFDKHGIKYSRIERYCDDAVVTHQIQKVLELTEGKRDLNRLTYLSWGNGFIANKFRMMFPNFAYTMIDPNREDISDERMKRICSDVDVVLLNHSHHKFKSSWLFDNKHQENHINTTVVINSSREGAFYAQTLPLNLPNFYSDVDGANAPHLFFESEDTYDNIKFFILGKLNE